MPVSHSLSPVEIAFFHQNGYLGPFAALSPDEMAPLVAHVETQVLGRDGPNPKTRFQSRHMDSKVVFDLATHPEIVDRMVSLYGSNLVLWATNFFNKEPGGLEIPWHQDLNYWPLEPVINISAWIALDDVKIDNSCVQLLPGSHKNMVPHIPSRDGMAFAYEADPSAFSTDGLINMELQPGEFFLFNEKLMHHSELNRSNRRRLGLSVRVTLPIVKISHDEWPLHLGHCAILVRGEDKMNFNRLMGAPASG